MADCCDYCHFIHYLLPPTRFFLCTQSLEAADYRTCYPYLHEFDGLQLVAKGTMRLITNLINGPQKSHRRSALRKRLYLLMSRPESEVKGYRALNDYPALTSLPMYTRHRVIASVVYLGRDDNARYFKLDGLVYRYSGPIQIGEQAALSGYRFRLKDRGYTQMGFINPSKNFTAALVIPRNRIEQHYHPSKEVVVTLEKMDGEWTTEKVYRK